MTTATAQIDPGNGPGRAPSLLASSDLGSRAAVRDTGDGGFASLIAEEDLTVGFVLLSLLVAMFWGASHALSPGHGKALVELAVEPREFLGGAGLRRFVAAPQRVLQQGDNFRIMSARSQA